MSRVEKLCRVGNWWFWIHEGIAYKTDLNGKGLWMKTENGWIQVEDEESFVLGDIPKYTARYKLNKYFRF